MKYNMYYLENIKEDIKNYIEENYEKNETLDYANCGDIIGFVEIPKDIVVESGIIQNVNDVTCLRLNFRGNTSIDIPLTDFAQNFKFDTEGTQVDFDFDKAESDEVKASIVDNSINTSNIADGAVTEDKLSETVGSVEGLHNKVNKAEAAVVAVASTTSELTSLKTTYDDDTVAEEIEAVLGYDNMDRVTSEHRGLMTKEMKAHLNNIGTIPNGTNDLLGGISSVYNEDTENYEDVLFAAVDDDDIAVLFN